MIQYHGGDGQALPARPSGPNAAEVRTCLERVLRSAEFERAGRVRLLLQYLVEQSLAGHADSLKESLIGIDVFGRDPGYDPKTEPVVRVTVGRLRSKLESYYQREGRNDAIRIAIPKGTYVPGFSATHQETAAAPAPPARRRPTARLLIGAAIVLLVAGSVGFRLATLASPPLFDNLHPFVTGKGSPNHPSFSPSGDTLAFDWSGPGDRHTNIYLQRLESSTPIRFTGDDADATWPVWSPDGREVAYLHQLAPNRMAIVSRPVLGSAERTWAEVQKGDTDRPRLDWSPDGKWFATAQRVNGIQSIVVLALAGGEKQVLTETPAGWRGDSEPVFSPDSRQVAFRRTQVASGVEDIYLVKVNGGEPRRLTFDNRPVSALVFTPDGGLIFSSKRTGSIRGLWWLPPGGGQLGRLTSTAVDAGSPTVSRDGKHVAFVKVLFDTDVWRVNADGSGDAKSLIASDLPDSGAQFSPDGQRVAFQSSRDGTQQIWTCDASGANPMRLTSAAGTTVGLPQWSPDGQWIAFEAYPKNRGEVHVISSRGGPERTVVSGPYDNTLPRWSADGRAIYFATNRAGHIQLWRASLERVNETPIMEDGYAATESHDGNALYFTRYSAPGIWKVDLRGGVPTGEAREVLPVARQDWGSAALGRNGIYYLDSSGNGARIAFFDFGLGTARTVHQPTQPLWRGAELALSPDEKTLLYSVIERDGMNIFAR
jgi:Tol biopolymer transport system component